MKKTAAVKNVDTKWRNDTTMLVGRIVRLDDNRQILVDYPGNTRGPLAARLTVSAKREILTGSNPAGREVLLAFIDNDPQRPLIVDAVYSLLDDITDIEGDRASGQRQGPGCSLTVNEWSSGPMKKLSWNAASHESHSQGRQSDH